AASRELDMGIVSVPIESRYHGEFRLSHFRPVRDVARITLYTIGQVAHYSDVLILGGGLAGLTLALELRERFPDLSIRVLERRTHPVPRAAHKVGESTVEIGAHYFSNVLGLRE